MRGQVSQDPRHALPCGVFASSRVMLTAVTPPTRAHGGSAVLRRARGLGERSEDLPAVLGAPASATLYQGTRWSKDRGAGELGGGLGRGYDVDGEISKN